MHVKNVRRKIIYKPFYVQLSIAQGATRNRLHSSVSILRISRHMNLSTCTYSKSAALDASRYCRL